MRPSRSSNLDPSTSTTASVTNRARKGSRRSRRRGEDGQALVEFVLVAPLLLLLLFAIIDFGLYLNQYDSATNLAEMGARAAIVAGTSNAGSSCTANGTTVTTPMASWLQCEATNSGTAQPTKVCIYDGSTVVGASTPVGAGDAITVKVSSPFNWLSFISASVGGLSSTATGSSTMRNEQPITNGNAFLASSSGC